MHKVICKQDSWEQNQQRPRGVPLHVIIIVRRLTQQNMLIIRAGKDAIEVVSNFSFLCVDVMTFKQ